MSILYIYIQFICSKKYSDRILYNIFLYLNIYLRVHQVFLYQWSRKVKKVYPLSTEKTLKV